MILFITAQQAQLDGPINQRFGRCPFLIQVNTETNQWEAFPNPGVGLSGGAGVAAAQFVIDQEASAVISGDFGPNAASAFRAATIDMHLFTNEISTAQQAVEGFIQGKLPAFE